MSSATSVRPATRSSARRQYEAVGEALDQISGEQVTAQQTAIDFSSASCSTWARA
jgi:hypothetical protein